MVASVPQATGPSSPAGMLLAPLRRCMSVRYWQSPSDEGNDRPTENENRDTELLLYTRTMVSIASICYLTPAATARKKCRLTYKLVIQYTVYSTVGGRPTCFWPFSPPQGLHSATICTCLQIQALYTTQQPAQLLPNTAETQLTAPWLMLGVLLGVLLPGFHPSRRLGSASVTSTTTPPSTKTLQGYQEDGTNDRDGDGDNENDIDAALFKWTILSCPAEDGVWESPCWTFATMTATYRGSFFRKDAPSTGRTSAWCLLTARTAAHRLDTSQRRSRPPRRENRPSAALRRSMTATTRPPA